MTVSQKISVSLLITVVLFAGFAAVAFTGLFSLVETRFYNPAVAGGLQREASSDAASTQAYLDELTDRFGAALKEGAVKRSFLPNQAAEDIFERSRIFGLLSQGLPGLQSARFVDASGKRIHYSTVKADLLRQDNLSAAYRNYGDGPDDAPYDSVAAGAGSAPRVVVDAARERLIFCYPFTDSFDVYKGSAFFVLSLRSLADRLVSDGRLRVGEDLYALSEPAGFVSALPRAGRDGLKAAIASAWKAGAKGPLPLAAGAAGNGAAKGSAAYDLVSAKTSGGFFVARVVPESLFAFPAAMKAILLASFFLTCFLAVFLLFNLRQDPLVVVRERIKRFQITMLEEYYEKKEELDWSRLGKDLAQRKEEVRGELKRGLGRSALKRHGADVDSLIDASWEDMISALGARPAPAAPMVAQFDESRLQDILGRILAAAPASAPGAAPAIPARPAPAAPAVPAAPRPAPAKAAAAEPEDLEELEELEDLGDAEESAAPAVSRPAPAAVAAKPAAADAEDMEELEELEELGDAEAPAAPRAAAVQASAPAAAAESGGLEEPEELEELDDAEAPAAPAPKAAASVRAVQAASVEEDVEELEALESLDDADEDAASAEAAADEIAEEAEPEDMEALAAEELEALGSEVPELAPAGGPFAELDALTAALPPTGSVSDGLPLDFEPLDEVASVVSAPPADLDEVSELEEVEAEDEDSVPGRAKASNIRVMFDEDDDIPYIVETSGIELVDDDSSGPIGFLDREESGEAELVELTDEDAGELEELGELEDLDDVVVGGGDEAPGAPGSMHLDDLASAIEFAPAAESPEGADDGVADIPEVDVSSPFDTLFDTYFKDDEPEFPAESGGPAANSDAETPPESEEGAVVMADALSGASGDEGGYTDEILDASAAEIEARGAELLTLGAKLETLNAKLESLGVKLGTLGAEAEAPKAAPAAVETAAPAPEPVSGLEEVEIEASDAEPETLEDLPEAEVAELDSLPVQDPLRLFSAPGFAPIGPEILDLPVQEDEAAESPSSDALPIASAFPHSYTPFGGAGDYTTPAAPEIEELEGLDGERSDLPALLEPLDDEAGEPRPEDESSDASAIVLVDGLAFVSDETYQEAARDAKIDDEMKELAQSVLGSSLR